MRSSPQPLASALSAYLLLRFPRVPVDAGYLWVVSVVRGPRMGASSMKTIHSWNSDGELVNPVGKEVNRNSSIGQ